MDSTAVSPSQVVEEVDLRAVRRRGIGGTDVAAIAGVHPWKTGHDVWLQKMGLDEYTESEAAYWGKILEPIVGDEYAKREGVKIYRPEPRFVRHPSRRWMLGSLDWLVERRPIGVDAKTTNWRQAHRWGDQDTDQVPEEVICQAQWYLAITGATHGIQRWDIPVLIGQEYRIYRIFPDRDLQKMLADLCGTWWERYVLTKTPPPIDYTKSAQKLLERVFPRDHGEVRPATAEEAALATQYREIDAQIKALQMEQYRLRNLICNLIGMDAGLLGDGWKVTWKLTKSSTATEWEKVARAVALKAGLTPEEFEALRAPYVEQKAGVRRFLTTFKETDQ